MRMEKILLVVLLMIITVAISCAVGVEPMYVSNKALGGEQLNAYTPGTTDGKGLNNIGLLVKTSGKVTYRDTTAQYFYIDDGSGLKDGTKKPDGSDVIGVRVSYKDLVNPFTCPEVGTKWVITGISSTSQITVGEETKIIPTLRPRSDSDKTPIP